MRTSLTTANLICIILINSVLLLLPFTSHARDIEITPFIGKMFSADLINSQNGTDLVVTDDKNYGLAIAWQDSPNGQGQILLNTVSHDFISSSDLQEHSFDITYLHFSGVTQLKQQNYVTTISLQSFEVMQVI
jgi:hypothetical protein